MKDYYYIKLTPDAYDEAPMYVNQFGVLTATPATLKVFDDINKAIDFKQGNELMYPEYKISIERI